jgi:LPS-assembly protein
MTHESRVAPIRQSVVSRGWRVVAALAVFAALRGEIPNLHAQSLTPDRTSVFSSDSPDVKAEQKKALQESLSPQVKPVEGLDFQAPVIEFKKDTEEVIGKGGILIAEGGVQVQADEGTFNMKTKEGDVNGDVLMTTSAGVLSASSGRVNIPSETGSFKDLDFDIEEGGFNIFAEEARKISEFDYELEDVSLTSCHCPDGTRPWELKGTSCSITQEGYAHTYGTTMWFEGAPIFYAPYLSIPVKRERASGLLPPQFGYSNQNGALFRQPIFFDIDDTAGAMLSPFVATNSRVGAELDIEKRFSKKSSLDAGFIYSNESLRGQDPRGLDLEDFNDPYIDQNRTGGFWKQQWKSDPVDGAPIEALIDARYTSDDMFLREIPAPQIGPLQSQYLSSDAVVRGEAWGFLNAEGRASYTQNLSTNTPQDQQIQRLPEFALSTGETFRPFGPNPYGLKLVTGIGATGTNFTRSEGYDGLRFDINPTVSVPFHVKNFFRGQFSAQVHQTEYQMNDRMLVPDSTPLPDGSTEIASGISRTIPILSYGMSTGVERVYGLERDNWFSQLVSLGAQNEGSEIVKLKHTVEPFLGYTYIPGVDQQNNPLYDQLDRYRERSLISYGFTTRLYGKAQEPLERVREVEELAPSAETLPMYDLSDSLLDFGRGMIVAPQPMSDIREGAVRQLASFSLRQTYDNLVKNPDDDPQINAFSDINAALTLSPSYYFSTGFDVNYDPDTGGFASAGYSFGLRDDRDDVIRLRYNYIDSTVTSITNGDNTTDNNNVNQVEMNLEAKIFEQLRAGGYMMYDAEQQEMLMSRALLRFINSCKCWSADLGYTQTFNPQNEQVLFSFTFGGLGGISQGGMSQ